MTFYQGECITNCDDLEWSLDVASINSNDQYYFDVNTGRITVTKNTYSPLILTTIARKIAESCGNPSEWSNGITRYYGVVGPTNNFNKESSHLQSSSDNFPLSVIYSASEQKIRIEKLDLHDWLQHKFANRNLNSEEVKLIMYHMNNYDPNQKLYFLFLKCLADNWFLKKK